MPLSPALRKQAGRSLSVWYHPGLYSKFWSSQGYTMRLCLKRNTQIKKRRLKGHQIQPFYLPPPWWALIRDLNNPLGQPQISETAWIPRQTFHPEGPSQEAWSRKYRWPKLWLSLFWMSKSQNVIIPVRSVLVSLSGCRRCQEDYGEQRRCLAPGPRGFNPLRWGGWSGAGHLLPCWPGSKEHLCSVAFWLPAS